jgi:hypothetical protein
MAGMVRGSVLGVAAAALLTASAAAQQPVPGNLQATASGPTTVKLSWTAPAAANGYIVQRGIGQSALERLTPDKITATAYTDAAAPTATALRYRVKAFFPGGATSLSAIVSVTTPSAPSNTASTGQSGPPPGQPTSESSIAPSPGAQTTIAAGATRERTYTAIAPNTSGTLTAVAPTAAPAPGPATATAADPNGFSATLQGTKVALTWQAVPGVSWYLLGGPGMGQYGQQVQGTSYSFDTPGPGEHEWTVASLAGQGQGPLNNWVGWPKAKLSIAPEVVHSARYRVTVIGFHVNEESIDDWWSWDGKGDEVYLAAYVGLKDRRNDIVSMRGHVQTVIYGDVNNLPGRIEAGTRSNLGGLQTGDSYPENAGSTLPAAGPEPDRIPLLVWEGPLTDGADELVVAPSIWESDQHDQHYIRWWQKMDQIIPEFFNDSSVKANVTSPGLQSATARELDVGIPGPGVDRPIGMRPVGASIGWIRQQAVVLTREKIEAALNSPYSVGGPPVGVIPVALTDWPAPNVGLGAGYTMYLRVQRLP